MEAFVSKMRAGKAVPKFLHNRIAVAPTTEALANASAALASNGRILRITIDMLIATSAVSRP